MIHVTSSRPGRLSTASTLPIFEEILLLTVIPVYPHPRRVLR